MNFIGGKSGSNDYLKGTSGSERMSGYSGDDRIEGFGGNDYLAGGDGRDSLYGGDGNDTVEGHNGNDWLYGGSGNDSMLGGEGNDTVYGESGNDTLTADWGNDLLVGGEGSDRLNIYGPGNHTAEGGAGNDFFRSWTDTADTRVLDGGAGADYFEVASRMYGSTGGGHGVYALGKVIFRNLDLSDTLDFKGFHDVTWNRNCFTFNKTGSFEGQNYKILEMKGYDGSGHGKYGELWFPAHFSEAQIASRVLLDNSDYVGQHYALV